MLIKWKENKETYSKASCVWAGSILIKIFIVTETTMCQEPGPPQTGAVLLAVSAGS